MAYDEYLADRLRQQFAQRHLAFLEKRMMGGLCFMVNDKMCLGIAGERLMARVDPASYEALLGEPGARPMDFTGRPMKGFLFIDADALDDERELAAWVDRCLEFNPRARRSRRRGEG